MKTLKHKSKTLSRELERLFLDSAPILKRLYALSTIPDIKYANGYYVFMQEIILNSVKAIEPKIDKIVFCSEDSYFTLNGVIGKLKKSEDIKAKKRREGYKDNYYCQLENGLRLNIFLEPDRTKEKYRNHPNCIIENSDHPKYNRFKVQELILFLINRLPDMKLSAIEYTIDFTFEAYARASEFIYIFLKSAFLSRQNLPSKKDRREKKKAGKEYQWVSKSKGLSPTYYFGRGGEPRRPWLWKIYRLKSSNQSVIRFERTLCGDTLKKLFHKRNPELFLKDVNFMAAFKPLEFKRTKIKKFRNVYHQGFYVLDAFMKERMKSSKLRPEDLLKPDSVFMKFWSKRVKKAGRDYDDAWFDNYEKTIEPKLVKSSEPEDSDDDEFY